MDQEKLQKWKCFFCGLTDNVLPVCSNCGRPREERVNRWWAIIVLVGCCFCGGSMATCSIQGLADPLAKRDWSTDLFWACLVIGVLVVMTGAYVVWFTWKNGKPPSIFR